MNALNASYLNLTRDAFHHCADTLALARSPLASGPLIAPALILDAAAPSADERGRALRVVLEWAVEQLAPVGASTRARAAQGDAIARREPNWWRYNILRYGYLERAAEHQTETAEPLQQGISPHFLERVGLPTVERYLDERTRAFRDAAQWIERQTQKDVGAQRIRALALEQFSLALQANKQHAHLLALASIFPDAFARAALLELARAESLSDAESMLESLLAQRALHSGNQGRMLWMSAPLRDHIAQRQPRALQQSRHEMAARIVGDLGDALGAAQHLLEAGAAHQSVRALLALPAEAVAGQMDRVLALTQRFDSTQLAAAEWRALNLLKADLLQETGNLEEAVNAWREALRAARAPREQATVYARMGKLYEERHPEQALTCYALAIEHLTPPATPAPSDRDVADAQLDEERAEVLKDRGWLYIQLHEWAAAEKDLTAALAALSANELAIRADVYEALSSLRRGTGEYALAIEHAQAALALREAMGNAMRVGRAHNSLGILYRITEEYENAIQAYDKALAIFERMDNLTLAATALLNLGTAHHFIERLADAEQYYRRCLALAEVVGLPLTEVRAYANLCEALLGQQRETEAQLNWRAAHSLSLQWGFDEEIAYLLEVAARYPALQAEITALAQRAPAAEGAPSAAVAPENEASAGAPTTYADSAELRLRTRADAELAFSGAAENGKAAGRAAYGAHLDAAEAQALALVERTGRINVANLMETAQLSKATATRKMGRLVELGLLLRHGQGRSTYYTRTHDVPAVVVAGDLAGLQSRLDAVLPRFVQEYAIERAHVAAILHAAAADGEGESRYEVRATFRRNPDLSSFFALERALSDATRTRIKLTL